MKIGYLQIGSSEHGVCRYSKLLAREAQKRKNLNVTEVNITLKRDWKHNRAILTDAAKQLSAADVVHFQYSLGNNKNLWGQSWLKLYSLWVFVSHCSSPLVVTLHDIYPLPSFSTEAFNFINRWFQPTVSTTTEKNTVASSVASTPKKIKLSNPISKLFATLRRISGAKLEAFTLRWLLSRVELVFVCSEVEAQRLKAIVNNNKTRIVPIYVEERSITIDRQKARELLRLDKNQKIITLLGFIHPRKGHQLIVEAMSKLPADVIAIFAGSTSPDPYSQAYLEQLFRLAKASGVECRLRVTGYLSEEELELYLLATDLAVCPFQNLSASASLSTWISVARPILAFDLPQIAEYNKLEPGAIKTFSPYTSDALVDAIANFLNANHDEIEPAVDRLRTKLSVTTIFDRLLTYYDNFAKKYELLELSTNL